MVNHISFKGYTIVSCGTLRRELNHLRETGFLDADKILYTVPGLHENLRELKKQLTKQLNNAKKYSNRIIVIFGDTCYLPEDIDEFLRGVEEREGVEITRVDAMHCVDMLAEESEREKIGGDRKIYWLPPGWFEYRKVVFKNWDPGMANETFPQNDAAIMLDAVGVFEEYSLNSPEDILEFSDWMKIGMEPYNISLDRLKNLLAKCVIDNEVRQK